MGRSEKNASILQASSEQTIIGRLRQHAAEMPQKEAYRFLSETGEPAQTLTYSELDSRARRVAGALTEHARRGDRAVLLYASGLEFIEAFLGCLYAGVIAVPATLPGKNRFATVLGEIHRDATPNVILSTSDVAARIRNYMPDGAVTKSTPLYTDLLAAKPNDVWRIPDIDPDSVALLQYTSGSTGSPKGVAVTHRNIMANQQSMSLGLRLSRESVVVGWLPLFHDWGLMGNVLGPLYSGFPCEVNP